jgi:large subunit ribosomal protein L21
MKYAVIRTGGKQYRVAEGEEILVDKLEEEKDKALTFDEILLLVDGEKVKVGQPLVKGVKVKAKVVDQVKGKKLRIATFKAKARYRRVKGFRPLLTKVKIEKIV